MGKVHLVLTLHKNKAVFLPLLGVYSVNLTSGKIFLLQLFTSPEKCPVNVSTHVPSSRS